MAYIKNTFLQLRPLVNTQHNNINNNENNLYQLNTINNNLKNNKNSELINVIDNNNTYTEINSIEDNESDNLKNLYSNNLSNLVNYSNGILYFYIDNNLVYIDDWSNNSFLLQTFEVKKGIHNFSWVYYYYLEKNSYQLRLEVRLIEGTNNSYVAYECIKCKKGINYKFDYSCNYCKEGMYLNLEKTKCETCKKGYTSYRATDNKKEEEACFKKPICNMNNFNIIKKKSNLIVEKENPVICIDEYNLETILYEIINHYSYKNFTYTNISNVIDYNENNTLKLTYYNITNFDKNEINNFFNEYNNFDNLYLNNTTNSNKNLDLNKTSFYSLLKNGNINNINTNNNIDCLNNFYKINYLSLPGILGDDEGFDLNECVGLEAGVCHYWNSWYVKSNKIISRQYNPNNVAFVLTKSFKLLDNGLLNYKFNIDSDYYLKNNLTNSEQETFSITINGIEIEKHYANQSITIEKNFVFSELKTAYYNNTSYNKYSKNNEVKNNYYLQLIYNRTTSENIDNFVTISKLEILGIDSSNSDALCINCNFKFNQADVLNKFKKYCKTHNNNYESKDNNYISYNIKNDIKNITCPRYTTYNENKYCKLNDIVLNKPFELLFNVKGIKEELLKTNNIYYEFFDSSLVSSSINNNLSNEYNMLGPIEVNSNNYYSSENDLIYFNIFDNFNYNFNNKFITTKYTNLKSGHFFLVEQEKDTFQSTIINNKNNTSLININSKIIYNIGSIITNVSVIPHTNEINLENYGILIEYSNGDICKENINIKYKTVLIIYCNKDISMSKPYFVSYDNCTFYFVYYSKFGCPNCIDNEIEKFKTTCVDNKQKILTIESPFCIINKLNQNEIKSYYDISKEEFDAQYELINNLIKKSLNLKKTFNDEIFKYNYILNKNSDKSIFKDIDKSIFKNQHNINNNLSNNSVVDNKIYSSILRYITSDKTKNINNYYSNFVFEDVEVLNCSYFDNYSKATKMLIIICPILYLFVLALFLLFYFNYRKLINQYELISSDTDSSVNDVELSTFQ